MPTQLEQGITALPDLVPSLHLAKGFADIVAALKSGQSATIDGAWGSACALTAASIVRESPQTVVIVLPRLNDVDEFADDVSGFLDETPLIFPAWETLPQENETADAIFGGRLRILRAMAKATPPRLIVTSIQALLQPVPSRDELVRGTRTLKTGNEIDPDTLLGWLVEQGFERVTGIRLPGEFSMHGGIVDIFAPDALDPVRIEFFGDEIESIRSFDVETQRTVETLEQVDITLVTPVGSAANATDENPDHGLGGEHFIDSIPPNSWIALVELDDLVSEGRNYLARLNDPRGMYSVDATLKRCTQFPSVIIAPIAADSMEASCHLQIESIDRFTGPKSEVLQELESVVGNDERVLIACHNEGEQERLTELLKESGLSLAERVQLCIGRLTRGFRMVAEKIVVLSDHELFSRAYVRTVKKTKRRVESRAIDSFLDLNEGDLIVHLTNGIGRFRGMKLLTKDEQVEEHLVLEFRGRVQVYVPVSLIHLVQKYVGGAKSAPELSKLGTTSWSKKKDRVAEAVTDMAADMIRLQAAREAKPGIAFPIDSYWQQEFDAAFPYTATRDQADAIVDCKEDLERPRPMDRLICGDVGYGKTEVAMRAAFKCIDAGKQVAILVPTTVLAEQHFRTITERMAEFPITIESLSRFKTKAQQRKILAGMESGAIDLVVGTHRLIQKDIKFKDLGLLVIDEEQRFGVDAKEMLKRLRLELDVLTLSATPIPRTLHMSLLGIRDISNLETAPQDRMPVVTRVCRFDGDLVRQAIIRELNRNGQVFFVHNRVYNIQSIADRIRSIVPEARVDIGHGQMQGHELEEAMVSFVSGQTDVLVCTTIIESGVDIPNANTIFIHQPNLYGLADLHQLRGRVGRYKHRAYCYLLLEDGKPMTVTATKRLKAIEEYSELGAGFKIAMRDLEIRGAGNILGTQQSGHIASVGYELYCQLLENAVRRLKNEPPRQNNHVAIDLPISAFLPNSYIPPGRQKIEMYRKLSLVKTFSEFEDLSHEMRDRFGSMPVEVSRLLELKEIQLLAIRWGVVGIHLEDHFAVLQYQNPGRIRELANRCGSDLRIVDSRNAYLLLPSRQFPIDQLAALLKSVLRLD